MFNDVIGEANRIVWESDMQDMLLSLDLSEQERESLEGFRTEVATLQTSSLQNLQDQWDGDIRNCQDYDPTSYMAAWMIADCELAARGAPSGRTMWLDMLDRHGRR